MSDEGHPPANIQTLSPQVIAEAGVWVARLHGLNAQSAKQGLRRWLAENESHRQAFELATEVWEESGSLRGLVTTHLARSAPPPAAGARWVRSGMVAATALLAIAGSVLYFSRPPPGVTTGVGEQRLLTLEDGTRIWLNTSTNLVVRYDRSFRRVNLNEGEALFDVVKNPQRPFVVTAGDRQVTALGTSFEVRREGPRITVVLVEGRVTVARIAEVAIRAKRETPEVEVLNPGQRVTFAAGGDARLDRPPMEKITDWQRGKVNLDDVSLADAVAEMNRYSIVQLRVERAEAAAVRVSGIFRAGDSMSFARAVSQAYGLVPLEQAHEIVLTGVPRESVATGDPTAADRAHAP
jgi:transmembrane sensor